MAYYHSCPNDVVLSDTELSNAIISLLRTMNNAVSVTCLCNLLMQHLLTLFVHLIAVIFGSY